MVVMQRYLLTNSGANYDNKAAMVRRAPRAVNFRGERSCKSLGMAWYENRQIEELLGHSSHACDTDAWYER